MAKKEYFEFSKRQSKPRKYLETSAYVVAGEVSSEAHLKFLNQRDEDQGVYWTKQETSRRGPSLLESKNEIFASRSYS